MRVPVVCLLVLLFVPTAAADVTPAFELEDTSAKDAPSTGSPFVLTVTMRANFGVEDRVVRVVPAGDLRVEGAERFVADTPEGRRLLVEVVLLPEREGPWSVGLVFETRHEGRFLTTEPLCCVYGWSSLGGGAVALDPLDLIEVDSDLRLVPHDRADGVGWTVEGDWSTPVPRARLEFLSVENRNTTNGLLLVAERQEGVTQILDLEGRVWVDFPVPKGSWGEMPRPALHELSYVVVLCERYEVRPQRASPAWEAQGDCAQWYGLAPGVPPIWLPLTLLVGLAGLQRGRRRA